MDKVSQDALFIFIVAFAFLWLGYWFGVTKSWKGLLFFTIADIIFLLIGFRARQNKLKKRKLKR
jgi:uncharacterized membrane protein